MVVVCHCAVITDREVIASIAAGARNVAEICRTTLAGRTCGGCVPTLRELACQHCPLSGPNADKQRARTPSLEVAGASA